MAEWSKAAVLKAASQLKLTRGFKSYSFRAMLCITGELRPVMQSIET